MICNTKSYLTGLALVVLVTVLPHWSHAAHIYLEPDTIYITDGSIGTEFDLEVRVDASTVGMRLYELLVNYQPGLLDTVSFTLGPLLDNSGYSVFDAYKIVESDEDTALYFLGILMGPDAVVDGPGVVATVRLRTKQAGEADLGIFNAVLTDVNNDTIPSTSEGSIVFINTPPDSPVLIEPAWGESVSGLPGEEFDLVWSESRSVYPGEGILYTLDYSKTSAFLPESTVTVTGLIDTTFTLYVDDLRSGQYYWRVKAIGNIYGFESDPDLYPSWFQFVYGAVEPEQYDLLVPADGSLININNKEFLLYDWEDAASANPNDTIKYILYLSSDPAFTPGSELHVDSTEDVSEMNIPTAILPLAEWGYWKVNAINKYDLYRWSSSTFSIMHYWRGDLDNSRFIDITDLVFLVDYMFADGPAPDVLEAADMNCSGGIIDVSDLVFLVDYMFLEGPYPDCDM